MSKSLGNVIVPQEIIKKFGAEILRLWVSAEDYREDVRISDEILNRLVEAYRRLRNTARFLISNLYDFNPARDSVRPDELDELDRWILHRTENLLARCREAYNRFEFHVVYHSLNNFCSVDLSAQYLDIVKDRLYCAGTQGQQRRAAQTALYRILDVLVHLMAPILSFTAEEIWTYMPPQAGRQASVFLSSIPKANESGADAELGEKWDRLFKERSEVLKALEEARTMGVIGHSLDAKVVLVCGNGATASLLPDLIRSEKAKTQDLLIVSQAEVSSDLPALGSPFTTYEAELLNCRIVVSKAAGGKCERCWKYDTEVGKNPAHPTVCSRCAKVLQSGART
jgi:isoleucyl-tRNA synthetase